MWYRPIDGGTRKTYIDGDRGFIHRILTGKQDHAAAKRTHAMVLGAIDFNSSAAAEEEVKNIAAAQHSGIKLDEVRFYNSALSSAEITHMYNYGKGDLAKVGGFSSVPTTISWNRRNCPLLNGYGKFPQCLVLCI